METRLTQEQLTQIVGEMERLSQRRQDEIDPEQLEEILREMGLPLDLLDEAMVQLHRREALAAQRRHNQKIMVGVAACLMVVLGGAGFWWQQSQRSLARIYAQQDRITLAKDDGGSLTTVARPAEVVYRVTLKDAPVGKKLDLSCEWTALGDQVLKQNRYQTKEITTPIWNTQCKNTIAASAPAGNWRVKLLLGDRPLSDATFAVK